MRARVLRPSPVMVHVPATCPKCTAALWAKFTPAEVARARTLRPDHTLVVIAHGERGCGADVRIRAGDVVAAAAPRRQLQPTG